MTEFRLYFSDSDEAHAAQSLGFSARIAANRASNTRWSRRPPSAAGIRRTSSRGDGARRRRPPTGPALRRARC